MLTQKVVYLTTITTSGHPWTNPVWFLEDGLDLLIYSLPDARKVTNLRANPKVCVLVAGDDAGHGFRTWKAHAELSDGNPLTDPAYLAKYRTDIEEDAAAGVAPPLEEYAMYSVRIRLIPDGKPFSL